MITFNSSYRDASERRLNSRWTNKETKSGWMLWLVNGTWKNWHMGVWVMSNASIDVNGRTSKIYFLSVELTFDERACAALTTKVFEVKEADSRLSALASTESIKKTQIIKNNVSKLQLFDDRERLSAQTRRSQSKYRSSYWLKSHGKQ